MSSKEVESHFSRMSLGPQSAGSSASSIASAVSAASGVSAATNRHTLNDNMDWSTGAGVSRSSSTSSTSSVALGTASVHGTDEATELQSQNAPHSAPLGSLPNIRQFHSHPNFGDRVPSSVAPAVSQRSLPSDTAASLPTQTFPATRQKTVSEPPSLSHSAGGSPSLRPQAPSLVTGYSAPAATKLNSVTTDTKLEKSALTSDVTSAATSASNSTSTLTSNTTTNPSSTSESSATPASASASASGTAFNFTNSIRPPVRAAPTAPAVPTATNSIKPKPKLSLSDRRGLHKLQMPTIQQDEELKTAPPRRKPNLRLGPAVTRGPGGPGAPASAPPSGSGSGSGSGSSIFSSYSRFIDIKTGTLNFYGKASVHAHGVDFSSGSSFRICLDDLQFISELGHGNYGTVSKVLHKPTNVIMAMKEIRLELDESKFSQIIMELDVLHKCHSPYIVDFYGAFFAEGAVYMCIEYMDGGSLDQIYAGGVPECYLGVITESVIQGLKTLKDQFNIIHRDVKPTNILVSTSGTVKLCDFGVSGNLVASIAKTNIGCQSYMAPERIRSASSLNSDVISYSVQSDIWSLGLTILEVGKGMYPYPPETYSNIFSQLSAIVDGEPPSLAEWSDAANYLGPDGRYADELLLREEPRKFSPLANEFIRACLNKDPRKRPDYSHLLQHEWVRRFSELLKAGKIHIGEFVKARLEEKREVAGPVPALHRGGLIGVETDPRV